MSKAGLRIRIRFYYCRIRILVDSTRIHHPALIYPDTGSRLFFEDQVRIRVVFRGSDPGCFSRIRFGSGLVFEDQIRVVFRGSDSDPGWFLRIVSGSGLLFKDQIRVDFSRIISGSGLVFDDRIRVNFTLSFNNPYLKSSFLSIYCHQTYNLIQN